MVILLYILILTCFLAHSDPVNAQSPIYIHPIVHHNFTADPIEYNLEGLQRDLGYGNKNTIVGFSFGFEYVTDRFTLGETQNWDVNPAMLQTALDGAIAYNYPVLVHLNGHHWVEIPHLASMPSVYMWDQDGRPVNRIPGYKINAGASTWSLNYYNHPYRDLKKKNIQQIGALLVDFAKANPYLFAGVSLDSEIAFMSNGGIPYDISYDYNPDTIIQWKYWLSGDTGSYQNPDYVNPYTTDSTYQLRSKNLTLAQINSRYGTSYTSWSQLTPPKSSGNYQAEPGTPASKWADWLEFKAHLVNVTLLESARWLAQIGMERTKIYSHQAPHSSNTQENTIRQFWGLTLSSNNIAGYGYGITAYENDILDYAAHTQVSQTNSNWGFFEWNPMETAASSTLTALNTYANLGIDQLTPNNYYPGTLTNDIYNIRLKPAVMSGIKQFISSRSLVSGNSPGGYFDVIDANSARGWACDFNDPNRQIMVELIKNANTATASSYGLFKANTPKSQAVADACDSAHPNHGFVIPTPNDLTNGDLLYIYALKANSNEKYLLSKSPQPAPVATPIPTPTNRVDWLSFQTFLSHFTTIFDFSSLLSRFGQ